MELIRAKWINIKFVIYLWLAWAVILFGFQAMVRSRFQPAWPDQALIWTKDVTGPNYEAGKVYLNEPFLNDQVAWDSEYYLSIAVTGYEDTKVDSVTLPYNASQRGGSPVPLNYAFFPLYPYLMHLLAFPLSILGLNKIATAALAGYLISIFGTLAGMLALFQLALEEFNQAGALRTVFYMIIFPSGFFLAQVYTEGLFIGLAFTCILLIRHRKFGWAALMAVLATWTRAVGVALIIPMIFTWLQDLHKEGVAFKPFPFRVAADGLLTLASLAAFIAWRISPLGVAFGLVESNYFHRGLFTIRSSISAWAGAFRSLFGPNPATQVYYVVEFGAIFLAVLACLLTLRKHPDLALFGFVVIFTSLFSGEPQGMPRYVLPVMPIYMVLSKWGENQVFDRAWTILSLLIMGLLATLFTFKMWAG